MSIEEHQRDWEELARVDPFWAILSVPEHRGSRDLDRFFESGQAIVDGVMQRAERLDLPRRRDRALDFGCGVGRLTRALGSHFDEVVGVDISTEMLDRARELNAAHAALSFDHNLRGGLDDYPDGSFDAVFSNIVLQHLPGRPMMRRVVRDFVRVLRPGGLAMFQVPASLSWRSRIQLKRRLYGTLHRLGFRPETLQERWKLTPVRMNALRPADVERNVAAAGGRVVDSHGIDRQRHRHVWYFVTS